MMDGWDGGTCVEVLSEDHPGDQAPIRQMVAGRFACQGFKIADEVGLIAEACREGQVGEGFGLARVEGVQHPLQPQIAGQGLGRHPDQFPGGALQLPQAEPVDAGKLAKDRHPAGAGEPVHKGPSRFGRRWTTRLGFQQPLG